MVSYLLSKKIFASQIAGQRLSSVDPDQLIISEVPSPWQEIKIGHWRPGTCCLWRSI
jgi:hypothetical protein